MNAVADAVQTFGARLSHVSLTLLALAVCLHVAGLLLRATAWRGVLAAAVPGGRPQRRTVTGAYLAGAGVNNVVPARGGDVARVVIACRALPGVCCATVAAGLLVESLLDAIVGSSLLVWAIWSGALPLSLLAVRGGSPGVIAAAAVAVAIVVVATRRRSAAGRLARELRRGLSVLTSPRAYATTVAAPQLLSWVARIGGMLCFLHAFHITAGPRQAVLAVLAGSITTVLPITPGGVGTQQALLAVLLAGVATPAAAISFSLGTQLVTTCVDVAIGGTCMGVMLGTLPWRARMAAPAAAVLPATTSGE